MRTLAPQHPKAYVSDYPENYRETSILESLPPELR